MDALEDVYECRVRFEETDLQGIVFYGNYATYQDEAVSEFMRRVGYGYEDDWRGWDIHVAHLELDYRGQAGFGDPVVNGVRVDRFGESSIEWSYAARLAETDELLVDGELVHVAVDDAGNPTRVPDDFREAVTAFQTVPPGSN